MKFKPEQSLAEFANELLPIAERDQSDPAFITQLRDWHKKHRVLILGLPTDADLENDSSGLYHSDLDELWGVHRFLFETEADNFPITQSAVELARHTTNWHIGRGNSWQTHDIGRLLPKLLFHGIDGSCDECIGFNLVYFSSRSHRVVLECNFCAAIFPAAATKFEISDRIDDPFAIADRPATKRELLDAGLFEIAE